MIASAKLPAQECEDDDNVEQPASGDAVQVASSGNGHKRSQANKSTLRKQPKAVSIAEAKIVSRDVMMSVSEDTNDEVDDDSTTVTDDFEPVPVDLRIASEQQQQEYAAARPSDRLMDQSLHLSNPSSTPG